MYDGPADYSTCLDVRQVYVFLVPGRGPDSKMRCAANPEFQEKPSCVRA